MQHPPTQLEAVREAAAAADVGLPADGEWPCRGEAAIELSAFVCESLCSDPTLLGDLLGSGDLETAYPDAESLRSRVREATGQASDKADLARRLRRLRTREMVRIAWRDLGECADLEETLRDLSVFADAAIGGALERLDEWQRARRGTPRDRSGRAQQLVVFALGKLGAEELNFSSDVDLIFAYPHDGETDAERRSVSNHEYFLELGRALIDVLQRRTADGYVFRVDMRLRPFGRAGALAMSFAGMEDYYQRHGRDWERYALIRMRPVGGDVAAGDALLERLEPFVFRRYLDFGTLESLREMKAMIAQEVVRRELDDHVKLGPGGIREIEFTTQAFQLVRGGRTPALRGRRIAQVLDELAKRELLPPFSVAELKDAYVFLRRLENRLQEYQDRQTHTLPDDEDRRAALAASMGFEDWSALRAALDVHRANVRGQFDQVLGGEAGDEDVEAGGTLLLSSQDEAALEALLGEYGFGAHAAAACERFVHLRDSYDCRAMDETGERRLRRLLPDLLRAVATSDDPLTTLDRVLSVVANILRRSTYLALLHERPITVSHFVHLCAASPWIAGRLADQPQLLDELLDARTLYAPPRRPELAADLEERLASVDTGDVELELSALRQFKHRQVLRVAAADIAEALPLMKVSDHLTEIAEVVLERVLALARRDVEARYGVPRRADGGAAQFVVVGYGKLGGIELGYGSDLDLVFLHGACSATTDGERTVDREVYFVRLAQRIVHYLSVSTPDGVLYPVDTRLRPHGKDGVLACSLESFEEYQRTKAWTWEHQALVRARVVAGDEELRADFASARERVLLTTRAPVRLLDEVRDMRRKMSEQLGTRDAQRFDLKHDRGGITDIEFIVQYAALRWGQRLGRHLACTDNIRLLEGLAKGGLIGADDAAALTDAFRQYRARVHRLSLQEQPAVVAGDEFSDTRRHVADAWERLMEAGGISREPQQRCGPPQRPV